MGYHFTPLKDGVINKLGANFGIYGTAGYSRKVKLFNRTSGLVLAEVFVPTSNNTWNFSNIPSVSVVAGQQYTVAVYLAGGAGSFRQSFGVFPLARGDIRIDASTYVSTFSSPDLRPTQVITNTMYGQVDVGFTPGTIQATPTPTPTPVPTPTPFPSAWSASGQPNMAIVDYSTRCTTLTVTAEGNAADVKLDLVGQHTYRASLKGTLGHNAQVATAFDFGFYPYGSGTFSLSGKALSGLTGSAKGVWEFCIFDRDGFGDSGSLQTWGIHN
jgi:hypothetical protein